ncbi:S9 family peptidase [Spirillospora sp. NPDC000708]
MPEYLDFVPEERFRRHLALSPDGTTIAYSSNVTGSFDLWTIPVVGGAARRVAGLDERSVWQIAWTPDGGSLVFTADRNGDEQYRIYQVAAGGGDPEEVSSGPDCQRVLADDPFDAEGRFLIYGANDRDRAVQDILIRDLSDGSERRIVPPAGVIFAPVRLSPSGRWLSATGARSNTDVAAYLIDVAGPGAEPVCVTVEYGHGLFAPGPWAPDSSAFYLCTDVWGEFTSIGRYSIDDAGLRRLTTDDWDVELLEAAGETLVWSRNEDGRSALQATKNGAPLLLPGIPQGVVDALSLTPDAEQIVLRIDSATRPSEIGVLDMAGGFRYLTDSRPPAMRAVQPVEPESITYPSANGRQVRAFLYRPHSPGPHPVLLSIHGGPEAQERPIYAYSGLYQHLLDQGIAIVAPNIAGSTGYGLTYQKLIYRDWGGVDLEDLDHAVRQIQATPGLDHDRIAVMGGSYGGFAALSCLSRLPYQWAAGVSFCGPTNLVTLAQACPPTWKSIVAAVLGDPETDADHLTRRSPVTYAEAITAPLLVIQGAHDPRVPQNESDQIVDRLRDRGVNVRYDIYSDEGHGFTNRKNELKAYGDIAQFIVKHLIGDR